MTATTFEMPNIVSLTDAVKIAARGTNIDFERFMALAITETGGYVAPRCLIATEGHKFDEYLPEELVARARAEGLAWGGGWDKSRHPRTQAEAYSRLKRMMEIHPAAALKATSMGWGQVLGANYKALGFDKVEQMWAMAQSPSGQSELVARFVQANNLKKHLDRLPNRQAAEAFARRYNGPLWRRNRYASKLIDNFRDVLSGAWQDPSERQAQIVRLQRNLKALGFAPGPIDGRRGPKTVAAVRAFQTSAGLAVDGIAGAMTLSAIEGALDDKRDAGAPVEAGVGTAVGVGGVSIATIMAAKDQVIQVIGAAEDLGAAAGLGGPVVPLLTSAVTIAALYFIVVRPYLERRRARA